MGSAAASSFPLADPASALPEGAAFAASFDRSPVVSSHARPGPRVIRRHLPSIPVPNSRAVSSEGTSASPDPA
jgi:hypothetical protein